MNTNTVFKAGWTGGQYSMFRALLGLYLLIHFAGLLPWSAELFSNQGMLANGQGSPLWAVFPSLLHFSDSPLAVQILVLSALPAALLMMLGWRDRLAALWLWYVLASLFCRNPLIANPALPYVGWMLLVHACMPTAPYGSLAAFNRRDPGGHWGMPRSLFVAASLVLALSYSYSGYTKLLSPSWLHGLTLGYVLENPLARDWWLRDLFLLLPHSILHGLTWFILIIELLYAPLMLLPRLRPWLWGILFIVQIGFLLLLNFPDLTTGMLLFHLLTFDPVWLRPTDTRPVQVFYDGHCALCHGVVSFILAEDIAARFRFAPLQGGHIRYTLDDDAREILPDSLVLLTPDQTVLTRSDAVIGILNRLGGLWRLGAIILNVISRSWRDMAYDAIGRHRIRVFGQSNQWCPVVQPALQSRFMTDGEK